MAAAVHRISKFTGKSAPPSNDMFQAAASGDCDWLRLSLKRALSPMQPDKEGLTVLHMVALHGRLDCLKLLLGSHSVDVNASCPRGRRPLHMVFTAQSRPHSYTCLSYLLEHGAQPNVSTEDGLTPLHLAATEGLMECTEALVRAGAGTHVQDSRGHTPLDLARIWGRRPIARFLKNAMWQRDKQKDVERRRSLQNLRQDLLRLHRQTQCREKVARQTVNEDKVMEWAEKKGLPLLWTPMMGKCMPTHARFFSPEKQGKPGQGEGAHKRLPGAPREAWNASPNPGKPPPGSVSRPQGVRASSQPESPPPEPDLRGSVALCRAANGHALYTAHWDGSPRRAPALPWDVLQRGLFPAAFPSRIASPQNFQASSVLDLPRLGCSPGPDASPWTEVAMHLAEELEPGHY